VDEVRQLVALRVVAMSDDAVRPALLRRLRKVRRLRRDLGLSLDAVVIVVRLLDRIEMLEGSRARRHGVRVIDEPLP
jgi:hypothetical protein